MFKKTNMKKTLAQVVRRITQYRLEEFRLYTLELEGKFTSDKNKLEAEYQNAQKGLSTEELHYIDDYFSDEYHQIENVHVNIYRKSTLVAVYTLLETSLHDLCGHLKRLNDYPVCVTDLRGEGVVRSILYLQKLASLDLTPVNASWSHIQAMNKLRNCIVHCDGNITSYKSRNSIENIASQNSALSLVDDTKLRIERDYIDKTIDEVEKLLNFIYSQTLNIT
ncbi:TPA: hypothetical protein RQK13_004358 [Vibrio vulnificus]|nr:hypothetical protein [Vibrio vulnificus]